MVADRRKLRDTNENMATEEDMRLSQDVTYEDFSKASLYGLTCAQVSEGATWASLYGLTCAQVSEGATWASPTLLHPTLHPGPLSRFMPVLHPHTSSHPSQVQREFRIFRKDGRQGRSVWIEGCGDATSEGGKLTPA